MPTNDPFKTSKDPPNHVRCGFAVSDKVFIQLYNPKGKPRRERRTEKSYPAKVLHQLSANSHTVYNRLLIMLSLTISEKNLIKPYIRLFKRTNRVHI